MNEADFHKISLNDLQIGNPILWNIYDAHGRLLARIGFVPQSEKQLETLIERGLFVDGEDYRQSNTHKGESSSALQSSVASNGSTNNLQHHLLNQMGSVLNTIQNVTLGLVANAPLTNIPEIVMKIVGTLNSVITNNPNIALAYIHFNQTPEGYANRHLVDVATLSMMVAREMQLPDAESNSIGAAALTMNVGMLTLQEDLQNRDKPPTAEERAFIHEHPKRSVTLLKETGVTNATWLDLVLTHHELLDGSGYPAGISGDKLSTGAKIIALADRYTAMIAARKLRKAIHPTQALSSLLVDNDKIYDPQITTFFIQVLGLYPPGCCVKLANGEVAIVASKGDSPTTPIVKVIKNIHGEALPNAEDRITTVEQFAIKEGVLLEAKDVPFTMQQIWKQEAF